MEIPGGNRNIPIPTTWGRMLGIQLFGHCKISSELTGRMRRLIFETDDRRLRRNVDQPRLVRLRLLDQLLSSNSLPQPFISISVTARPAPLVPKIIPWASVFRHAVCVTALIPTPASVRAPPGLAPPRLPLA